MKISAIWIAKNEEGNIGKSIESVKAVANEMFVVDTGSTDATVQEAQAAGAEVVHFEWIDDFSAAKNFALSQVSDDADVIVFLDSDQWFVPALGEKEVKIFEAWIKNHDTGVLTNTEINIDLDTGLTMAPVPIHRIFRAGKGIRYQGIIHEEYRYPDGGFVLGTEALDIIMYHSGYALESKTKKLERNIVLLEKELEQGISDPLRESLVHFYLLREYSNSETAKATEYVEWFLEDKERVLVIATKYMSFAFFFVFKIMKEIANGVFNISQHQFKSCVMNPIEKALSFRPEIAIFSLRFNSCFCYSERELLSKLDNIVANGERLSAKVGKDLDSEYTNDTVFLYKQAADASWVRGDTEKALEYAVKALTRVEIFLEIRSFSLILRCLKGVQATEIIMFLNKILPVNARGTLEVLVAALQFEGYKDAYVYYMKKIIDNGWAKKADFVYLLILLGKFSEAMELIVQKEQLEEEDIKRLALLACVCSGDESLYETAKELTAEYTPALNAFFGKKGGGKPEVRVLVLEVYQLIAFASGRAVANKFAKVWQDDEEMLFFAQYNYYKGAGLTKEFFEECKLPEVNNVVNSQVVMMIAEMQIMNGDYESATENLVNMTAKARVNDSWFNLFEVIEEKATDENVRKYASIVTTKHRPEFRLWQSGLDYMVYGYTKFESTKKDTKRFVNMSIKEFEKWCTNSTFTFRQKDEMFFMAACRHIKNKELCRALEMLNAINKKGVNGIATYKKMKQVFEALGNKTLQDYLSKKLAEIEKEIDAKFTDVMAEIENNSLDAVLENMKTAFGASRKSVQQSVENYTKRFSFWGEMDSKNSNYELLHNRANMLKNHGEDFNWLYGRLMDLESKIALLGYVRNVNMFDVAALGEAIDTLNDEYFNPEIVKCGEKEVLVDLGAYIGDTVDSYVKKYGRGGYSKIHCYEMDTANFKQLENKAIIFPDLVLHNKAVSDEAGEIHISLNEGDSSATSLKDAGEVAIEMVAIDDDIEEAITFLKMDIEGAEQAAIRGAKRHIHDDKPKLAISIYHNNEDVWKIPRMIDEICKGYEFYLSYHGGDVMPSELSLIAIHPEGLNTVTGEEEAFAIKRMENAMMGRVSVDNSEVDEVAQAEQEAH